MNLKSSSPAAPPAQPSEQGWLIEHSGKLPGVDAASISWIKVSPEWAGYGALEYSFTNDASKALRFSRKEDAESVLSLYLGPKRSADWFVDQFSVTEHQWPAPQAVSPPLSRSILEAAQARAEEAGQAALLLVPKTCVYCRLPIRVERQRCVSGQDCAAMIRTEPESETIRLKVERASLLISIREALEAVSPLPAAPIMGEAVLIPKELLRQLRHYTDCYLQKWPSCGAPTEAEIDAELVAAAPKEPSAGEAVALTDERDENLHRFLSTHNSLQDTVTIEEVLQNWRTADEQLELRSGPLYHGVDWKLAYQEEACKFQQETRRTSDLHRMLTRLVEICSPDHPLVEKARELLTRPINYTHPAPEAPKPPLDAEQEREKFEAWAELHCFALHRNHRYPEAYGSAITGAVWLGWQGHAFRQARAALAAAGDQGEAK